MGLDINGKMTKKLLYRTQQVYFIFSIVTLLLISPLFYLATERLYLEDADESLLLHKNQFVQQTLPQLVQSDIATWNKFNTEIKILPDQNTTGDSLFHTFYWLELEQENEPYRELHTPIEIEGVRYTFSAKINLLESEDLMLNIALLFFLLLFFLLLGVFLINKRLSASLWKPFYEILKEVENFEIDKNKSPQLTPTNIEEFARLSSSIDKLVKKNVLIYKNQQEFVENAAHELQTPIALLRAKLDVLIQNESLTKDQAQILGSINSTLSRLNRLNKNLLLLSNVNNTYGYPKASFSLGQLLETQLVFFEEQASIKKINIVLKVVGDTTIIGTSSLVEIILNNLLMNAIRHNYEGGEIDIILAGRSLQIKNTGNDSGLSQEQIFNRFSKTATSKGNGLGLAIVKKIIDLHQWQITYSFEENEHSFLLHF